MKNEILKKILPHVIAVVIFLVVSVFFCKPVLEGNVMSQRDIIGWKGIAQNAFDYKEATGHFPLWNPNLFSGMPNYLIAMDGKSILPDLNAVFSLGLPQPINFFFIACICFYILCLSLRLKPAIGVFGALAFAFCTYNPIIISAGHVTKMFAIAYMPLLLAGMLLTYHRKYWIGLAVTTLGAYMEIISNHPQIVFYFILVAAAVTLAYVYDWTRKREWKHMGIALGITAIAALAGLASNSLSFLVTSEYSKATMRGGKNIHIVGDKVEAVKTTGLDTNYAFSYSLGKAEIATLIMPNSFGGGAKHNLDENSHVVGKLVDRGVPETNAVQLAQSLSKFWGDSQSTAGGPLYAGALVCLLALIGFVLYKKPLRWALLGVSILAIFMAWGKNFSGFNLFLFDHLPLYNKFRSPSITMVIVQLTLPIAAALGLQQLLFRENARELLKADFRKILYAVGGLLALLILMYLAIDYGAPMDQQILAQKFDNSGSDEIGRLIVSGLKQDRQSLLGMQVLRTIAFAALLLGLLYLYLKNIMKPVAIVITLACITAIDLIVVDKDYLNEDNYRPKDELLAATLSKSAIDEQILKDKDPDFRVYDSSPSRFSDEDYHASAWHKSVGGYHPAKLRIYQDVMERYLYGSDDRQILNMLNTKYILAQNPQNGQQVVIPNPEAYGSCWLVKNVRLVKDDVEEIQGIGITNLKDTALVQESFKANVVQPQWDSASSISLIKFDNDAIEYAASCNSPQFAVFSEVYYPYGWNAYLDGKKVDYVKTDYVLRGLSLPAGKHTVKFVFEPASYKKGITISYIGSYLVALLVLGGLFMTWRESKGQKLKVKS